MADDGKYDITIRLLLLKQYLEANAGYRHPKNSPSKKFRKQGPVAKYAHKKTTSTIPKGLG